MRTHDPLVLPPDLPAPRDDGTARHLPGAALPTVTLKATDGRQVDLADLAARWVILYCYPRTGRPGEAPLVPDWDLIPGARGCTPEACSFRDHHQEIRAFGALVFGVSTQDTYYQREAVERLALPFPLLSDSDLALTRALRLPTFEVAEQVLMKRITLVVRDSRIEHLWYPVFPPDRHAEEVVGWLQRQHVRASGAHDPPSE
jgi:peroxiredoxin